MSEEGFFSRWSRRKQGLEAPEADKSLASSEPAVAQGADAPATSEAAAQPQALPTLQDAQALTPESDFQPFMQGGVGPEVRNAAMKKLFTDPHFNVMDGLDIYIEDYNQPDPMPAGCASRARRRQPTITRPQARANLRPRPQRLPVKTLAPTNRPTRQQYPQRRLPLWPNRPCQLHRPRPPSPLASDTLTAPV